MLSFVLFTTLVVLASGELLPCPLERAKALEAGRRVNLPECTEAGGWRLLYREHGVMPFEAIMASPMSSCVQERHVAIERTQHGMAGAVIPECEENGDWKPLQCSSGYCRCVSTNGTTLEGPSRELKSCTCITEFHKNYIPHMYGRFVASCEKSGYYTVIQCQEMNCWCVDPQTGEELHGKGMDYYPREKGDCVSAEHPALH